MIPIILKEKKEVAENTLLYVFNRPKDFSFLAGQYVSIKAVKTPFHDDRGDFRSFSIASAPYQKDVLEFAMRRGDSAFKKNLEGLSAGDGVEITPAVGKCVLGDPNPKNGIVFLTGGVGITPVRSILLESNYQRRPERFFLLNSNRFPEMAPFLEEFDQLGNLHLLQVHTMTDRELPGKPWDGERTRIDSAMIRKYVSMDWEECIFFVVGIGMFVQSMRDILLHEGVSSDKILTDDFGGSVK